MSYTGPTQKTKSYVALQANIDMTDLVRLPLNLAAALQNIDAK